MGILTDLLVRVGASLAKAVVRTWISDSELVVDLSGDLAELLEQAGFETWHSRDVAFEIERMCERAVRRLEPLMQGEAKAGMPLPEIEASVLAVIDTINRGFTPQAALQCSLDPELLLARLKAQDPGALRRGALSERGEKLYEAALSRCTVYLVTMVSDLPGFVPMFAVEILHTLRDMQARLDALYDSRDITDSASVLEFRTRYLEAVCRGLDAVNLYGLPTNRLAGRRYKLSVSYIALQTMTAAAPPAVDDPVDVNEFPSISRDDLRDEDEGDHAAVRRRAVAVESVVARSRRVLIRGPAGSGKTTLLQWLAVRAADESMPQELRHLNGYVPFFIRLRGYAGRDLPRPAEFIDSVASMISSAMPSGWVEGLLGSGEAIVLVDGIDEVRETDLAAVNRWFAQLLESFPDAVVVCTSRPLAGDSAFEAPSSFTVADLEPLGIENVYRFVDHWHEACALDVPPGRRAEFMRQAQELKEIIRHDGTLKMLVTNPLMGAIVCALHGDPDRDLPRDRTGVYGEALKMLLERRDLKRGLHDQGEVKLTAEQKQRLLEDLAWWLILEGYADVPKSLAINRIATTLQGMPGLPPADVVLKHMLDRTGVIREPIEERVDFVHKSFVEYLAALRALQLGEIDLLVQKAGTPTWDEVVTLAASAATVTAASALIEGLLARARTEPDLRKHLILLAATCVSGTRELPRCIQARVSAAIGALVPPREYGYLWLGSSSDLGALPFLTDLTRLRLAGPAGEHVDFGALARCKHLEYLSIAHAPGLERLADLGRIDGLKALHIQSAPDLVSLDGLDQFSLREFHLRSAPRLIDTGALAAPAVRLERLTLAGTSVFDLGTLSNLQTIKELDLRVGALRRPETLGVLPSLRELRLADVSHNLNLEFLSHADALEAVYVSDIAGQLVFAPNEKRPWQRLVILGCRVAGKISGVDEIVLSGGWHSDELDLGDVVDCRTLTIRRLEVRSVATLPEGLSDFVAERCRKLVAVDGLAGSGVTSVSLVKCHSLDTIEPLAECPRLERLIIDGLGRNVNLAPVARCSHLRSITTGVYPSRVAAITSVRVEAPQPAGRAV